MSLADERELGSGCAALLAAVLAMATDHRDLPFARELIALIVPDQTSNG
ncbi:hypothetical protein [Williamsia serinedens]